MAAASTYKMRISADARPSVENIVKSFIGITEAPGERTKNSTTASEVAAKRGKTVEEIFAA